MIRLATLAVLALLLARIVIVGRTAAATSQPGEPVTIELSVWGMPFENDLYTKVYIPEFERQNPGIKVRFHHFEDYNNRVLLTYAGDIAPDVMREGYEVSLAWSQRGMNLLLDPFIDGPDGIDRKDFIPMLWDGLVVDGKTYAVPQDINILGLFYNKDLFDKAGLKYPDASWTWEDLKRAVDKLTVDGKDGQNKVTGMDMAWNSFNFRPFMYAAGGKFWDGDRAVFDSPQTARALAYFKSLMRDYSLSQSNSTRGGLGPDKFFQAGRVAMYVDGSWMTPSIKKGAPKGFRFGVAPMPRDLKSLSTSGSCVWGISRTSKHPQEAWKLVKFLSSTEALKTYWSTLWVAPPARWSALRSPEFHNVHGIPGAVPGIESAAEFQEKCGWIPEVLEHRWTTLEYASPYTDRALMHLGEAVDKVLLKNADPLAALHQAAKDTNLQISQAKEAEALAQGKSR